MKTHFTHDLTTLAATDLEVKADSEGHISGYGSIFGNKDTYGHIVVPGAFTKSLAAHRSAGTMPVMLWSHMQESPIGRWHNVIEDGKGLRVDGRLNLKTDSGSQAYEHIRSGDVGGLSIGFRIRKDAQKYAGKGVFELEEIELHEVSVVAIPANPTARIDGVKSLSSKSDAIEMLRTCGLSKKAATRFAAGGWSALNTEYDPDKIKRLADAMDAATNKMRQD